MVTFLFWNINRKPLHDTVARIAQRHTADVILLAECPPPPEVILLALNPKRPGAFEMATTGVERLWVYTRFASTYLVPLYDAPHFTVRCLQLPTRISITLVAAHLPSKLHRSPESQRLAADDLALTIREWEAREGHERTVVVGDLNMNPFETGIASGGVLNAVMSRAVAARGTRSVGGRARPFFYNPMWGRFGDTSPGPPGTYYHDRGDPMGFYWNMFDQVLLRPELADRLGRDGVTILADDGEESFLLSDGRPNASAFPDHLPVLFELDL